MKKGIAFYEKALTLVDIQDNSAIKHIDTVTVKPGKEAELKHLIQEMDEAGLLTQKYQYSHLVLKKHSKHSKIFGTSLNKFVTFFLKTAQACSMGFKSGE